MTDFKFYLNKSGLRGAKGEKGDNGFSPSIVEGTNTINEYTLKVINEFDEFETPNLRGDQIDISDPNGTYVRYSQETGKSYVGSVDIASGDTYGMVRISNEEDFTDFSNDSAVTPASFADNLHNYLISPDNSVHINQNIETSLTELTVDTSAVEGLADRVDHLEDDTLYLENAVNDLSTGLANTDSRVSSLNTSLNGVKQDLTTEAQMRLNADNQQQQAIDAERQQRETQDAALQTQLNSKLTADNIKAGANVTITRSGNNVTINSTGGGGGGGTTYIPGDGIDISGDILSTKIDNQTIKFVDGVMHADFSEIGDEVNTLAGRVNTLEGEVGTLAEKVDDLQLYKFPNATIEGDPTINNGQITDFSTTNYLRFPFEFKTEGRTWLLNGSFDTDTDVTVQQNIIDSLASVALAVRNGRLILALSTNGTNFDLGEHESMSDIEPNTKYYYRLSFSGTQYLLSISTDKQEWLPEIIVASDQPIASKPMTISSPGHPYKGTINLNDWDLTVANALVWQGMDDVGIASRMDVNASNITETGIEKLKEVLGLGVIEALVDAINVNYDDSDINLGGNA